MFIKDLDRDIFSKIVGRNSIVQNSVGPLEVQVWPTSGAMIVPERNPKKNEDGDTKITTVIGGLYSILLRLIYIIAIVFFMRKMALA